MRSRILAFLTALIILITLLPVTALAADTNDTTGFTLHTKGRNPLLPPDVHTDVRTVAPTYNAVPADVEFETDPAVVSAILRDGMEQRKAVITIYYRTDHLMSEDELEALFYGAFAETGKETQGDYLSLSWREYNCPGSGVSYDGIYDYTLPYQVTYQTTAEQEAELAAELTHVMASFGFTENTSDYEKVCTIYDYICSNVSYDYENTYLLKYTAYAALMHKTSVCEGYAELFYRMAIRAGLQPRIITGTSHGEGHAWNIVKLGSLFYNLDSTWDAGMYGYNYFLKGSTDFPDHYRNEKFTTDLFHAHYPTAAVAYTSETTPEPTPDPTPNPSPEASPKPSPEPSPEPSSEPPQEPSPEPPSTPAPSPMSNPFIDVAPNNFFYDSVLWAVNRGITQGTSANTFSPYAPCTRAQAVTFLWRSAGCPEPLSTANPFVDISPDAFYYRAVLWAAENGITGGVGNHCFAPNQTCTRGQIVTFLYRTMCPKTTDTSNPFADVHPGNFYYNAVLWASSNGVTVGTSATTFSPNESCTRGQIVTFLYRASNQ